MSGFSASEQQRSAPPLVHDFLELAAARQPHKVALVYRGARVTYLELEHQANALAHALVAGGVARGDRVLIFGDNTIEMAVAIWATLKANAVICVVNPLTKADKLAHLLRECGPSALITQAQLVPIIDEVVPKASSVRLTIVAGAFDCALLPRAPHIVPWDAALAVHEHAAPPPRRCIDLDLAAIIHTSGTTGEPKGVMLTHLNMLSAAASVSAYLGLRDDDVIINVLPLAFTYGLYQLLLTCRAQARLVLERSFAYPAQVLNLMAAERVTVFPGVPTLFAMLAEMKTLKDIDLTSIRFVTSAAATLTGKHIQALRGFFPGAAIFSMYGQTECKRCTYLPPEDLERKPDSVGIPIPNTELWIVDEQDQKLGPNQVGQLVIRGATVMMGYWGKPEATAQKLRPGPVEGERVLYTGDLCRLDEEGYLYFISRMDDIIKSRGEKVAPKEVECVLTDISGVREAAVIGVDDPLLGQAVKAFVVCDQGVTLINKDLMRECQQRLESFMVPKYLEIVPELPKTNTGKIIKTGLK